jgi:amino acid transporter
MNMDVPDNNPGQPVAEGSFESADKNLRKTMGFSHLLFMSLAAIIGSGWLFASLKGAALAGPAVILSWVIGGILVIFIALTYAELSGMLPRSGSLSRYPNLTHGAYFGWFMGWAYFLAAVTVPAIEAEAVVTYVGGQTDVGLVHTVDGVPVMEWPNGVLFGIGLMILFFILNYFGIKLLAEVNRWVTLWKLVIPTISAIFLFTVVKGGNYHSYHGGFAPTGAASIFSAIATAGILFAYLGFRQALDFAGEARNPQRDVPRATILGVLIAMGVYVLLQVVFIGVINWKNAGIAPGDWHGLLSSSWASAPFVDAFRAAGVGWLATYAWVLLVDAGISPSGTGWVYMGAATRNVYGVAVHGFIPRVFQRSNRWGIPWAAALVAGVVGTLVMYPAPSWYELVGIITGMTALTYIGGGIAVPLLRKHAPGLRRPFRLSWYWLWSPLSFLAAILVVYWGGYATDVQLYAAVFLGLPIFVWYYAPRNGWFPASTARMLAAAAGLVFLAAWCYIQAEGGIVMRVAPSATGIAAPGSWGFVVYYVAMVADILFFCAAIWGLAGPKGRKDVMSGIWVIAMLLALLPVDYYGKFGPEAKPAIGFPYETFIAMGIGLVAWGWAILAGYNTDALQDITASAAGQEEVTSGAAV